MEGDKLRAMVEEAAERRVQFLKIREENVHEKELHLKQWAKLREILEISFKTDWPSGDILIRVHRQGIVASKTAEITPEICTVTAIDSEEPHGKTQP